MKKKVFSLMMTFVLAFMGVARADVVEIGSLEGATANTYLPMNSLYNYSYTQQIYTAAEMGMGGTINSITMWMYGTASLPARTFNIYLKEVGKEAFDGNTDWVTVAASDMVYSGTVAFNNTTAEAYTFVLDTPFEYSGTNNLLVCFNNLTGTWNSGLNGMVFGTVNDPIRAIYARQDTGAYDPYNPTFSATSTTYQRNVVNFDMTSGGGGGGVVAGELTVYDGTATNGFVPVYGFYADAYLKAEFVMPAAELADMANGDINSVKFYATSPATDAWTSTFQVFMKEVNDATISDFTGTDGATVVYEGLLNGTASEMEIVFSTPYHYNGGNLLIGVYNITTGNYKSITWAGETVTGASVQGYNYSSLSGITATQRNFLPKTTFAYTVAGGGGAPTDKLHVKYMAGDVEVIDELNLGVRPAGAWMEPFNFFMYSEGPTYTVNVLDFTPSDGMFTVAGQELPFQVVRNEDVALNMSTNGTEAGVIERQFVAITEGNRAAHVWPVTVELYAPQCPDVWELACQEATTFPFVEVPATAHATTLHNDYTLPFPEIPEGLDAVYKLVFTQDQMVNAEVTYGDNGKVALYREGFEGEGGPMATNNYTGIEMGGGAAAAPFEAQIGDGTSTTTYFPFYTFYNYCIAENLFLAPELEEAGVTTAPMTSLSWYATNEYGYNQQGITIWMANVDDETLTTTSHVVTGMTKVYTGAMTPAIGWNEFVFNEGTFSWDGHSNVLIYVQRNNGVYNSSISWQATSGLPFNAMSYRYQDSGAYDETIPNTMYTSTTRPNIIMKADGRRNRDEIVNDFESGLNGWTVIDANNDGYTWCLTSAIPSTWTYYSSLTLDWYHGGTNAICSGSYINGVGAITPDEFLVSPQVTLGAGSQISFWVAATDATYAADHFGVFISDNGTSGWTSVQEWTLTAKSGAKSGVVRESRDGNGLRLGNWYNYTVDLSAYAGQKYVAFRHFNCYDQYIMCLDDITLTTSGTNPNPPTPPTPPTPGTGGAALPISAGPVIENLPVTPGTYYLVASSTTPNFEVTINAEDMPCPATEDFAFNPVPADDADGIEPASVTLSWSIPDFATGWRLIFGTTYYPDPNHPQTIMYPEDGSFTTNLANSYTVRNLWNNTNYFWRVEFNNDCCPGGVSSPVWGFTTHLNVPQNLTAVDETVFNDETIVLNWTPVVDRTYRMYNVYRDGELIGHTNMNQINNSTYTDGPLAYNMAGYTYYVTAVYDEGESAPSNTVNVKVSGRGNVDGHVYEQDGTTGIAGATVTMVGIDEFNVSHTYNFTTNNQGYYSAAVYAGTYNGQAAKDGYQTITEPVQGNPIGITYNVTTSPIDYMLDENFDPVCSVLAEYYPDPEDINAPYVKVSWGCGLPGEEIIEDFETGDFSLFDWQVDATYPWTITTYQPYEGIYCMKSGGAGVANVVSNMSVTVEIPADGLMSFFGKISCESSWDYGYFYIDGVQKGSYTGAGNWAERQFDVTAGEHTFLWQYTKDGSVNSNDDCFYVDYINFYKQPEPPVPGMTYDFENSTMQGWTSLDADGDGYGWYVASDIMSTGYGHNGSNDCVLSQSYYSGMILYPDNYLVSPQVALGGVLTFYACAQDNLYAAEHFGVAVSTTSNNNPSAFTMLNEWTMTAKKAEPKSLDNAVADVSLKSYSRDGKNRAQGNWYQYTVDLSAYAGQSGYVAIRHFNCSDMFYLDVDDITISEPGKSAPASRALSHYRVYRTDCYNDGPYTEENTVLLATVWVPDTVYIDVEWADLPAGVYKWGVGTVYEGNRGELYESPINWGAPIAVNNKVEATRDELTYNFDDSSLQGWTTIDGGSPTGYGWHIGSNTLGTGYGHNGSTDLVISQSYDNNYGIVYPDNYLISPQVQLGGSISFWACAQDASYAAEHFGVAVSTTTNTSASAFTMLQEWTIGSKGVNGTKETIRGNRDQSTWIQYTVDLSAYSGMGYVAIRHFNCSDQYFLDVDDITINTSGGSTPPTPPTPPTPGTGGTQLVTFEDGQLPAGWVNDAAYPWTVGTPAYPGYNGNYCMMSGNSGIASSTSTMEATVTFVQDGSVSFLGGCWGEGTTTIWDHCQFFIDGNQQFDYGALQTWNTYSFNVTAGTHTFRWSYTKDSSVNPTGDAFFVDDITFDGVAGSGGGNGLQLPRESEIVWSNCLDKNMWLENALDVTVLLNSADSPEGVTVSFENLNPGEQQLYPMSSVVLDETGYYVWDSFRKGDYKVTVSLDGYETIEDIVSIWEPTSLRYVMIEIIYGVNNLYVSRTGWAMWDAEGLPSGGQGGGGGGGGQGATSFSDDFEGGLGNWTIVDADGDGHNWYHSSLSQTYSCYDYTGWGHNGSNGFAVSQSYTDCTYDSYDPNNFMITNQKYSITASSMLNFWADYGNDSYPDHFGVAVATADNPTPADFTIVWEGSAKSGDGKTQIRHDGDRYQNWRSHSVNLSAYAGQDVYIAFRHFNSYDQYEVYIDDVELTSGAKNDDRHLEGFKVLCTSIDGEPIYNANTVHPFCQLATDELVEGEHYICKVAAIYSTGMSDWVEAEWEYESCEHYAGTLNGVDVNGTTVTWDYPGGGTGPTPPGGGDSFTESWDNGLNGWTNIDNDGDGHMWYPSSDAGNHGTMAVDSHSGTGHVMGESYCNATYAALTPDDYLVSPQQYAIAAGSTISLWACTQDVSYPSEHFGFAISTSSNTNASDFTTIAEWTITAKGSGKGIVGRNGRASREGNWYQFSADLSSYAGQNVWIAVRHFNCTDMFILNIDDITLTAGAKSNRDVVFFNGFVTDPGAMANGADASWIKGSQSTWGPNVNNGGGYKLGDSFTLSAATTITEIEVYGYQTGSSTTSTFTGLYAQIYNGNPMSGGTAIWGSETTNIMTATSFTNCYRGSDGETTATTRPIMAITAGNLSIDLEAGTYWLVYSLEGTGSSGPWGAPHAEPGIGNTGNGIQYTTAWQTLLDSGAGTPYGCAMKLSGGGSGPVPPVPPAGNILGAMLFLNGEWEAFVPYPTNSYEFPEGGEYCVRIVYDGTADLPSNNFYYAMSCEECEGGEGTCEPGAPIHAEVLGETDQVKVWWGDAPLPPVPGMSEWLYYDNGTYSDAIGTGGSMVYWAAMFPAASIAPYAGTNLTKVALYEDPTLNTDVVTVAIYLGGTTAPQTMMSTQTFNPTGTEGFHEVALNTPVAVDGTQNLWIVFSEYGTYPATGCDDTGDANGRWISIDGVAWEDVASYGLNYTWLIRGFVTNEGKGGMVENIALEPVTPAAVETTNMTLGRSGREEITPADLSFMNRSEIQKYNVYRSADNANYTMIGEVAAVAGQTYYEYIDTPAGAGTYYYQVRADYGDCESEPAMAADDPSHNYVTATVDAIDENSDNVALFPNPTNGNVTIQANGMSHITVVSVLGQVVYDADLNADEVILNMGQFNAGMYMVRVYTKEGVTVKRVTVMQ